MIMQKEIDTVRKIPHMGTFQEAKKWVSSIKDIWGSQPFALLFDSCGIYYVTHRGNLIGKGVTYESAISDAERNWKHQTGELTLWGMQCA